MENILMLIGDNLIKAGIGAGMFLIVYLSNMGLGAWRSIKINGYNFDWKLIGSSILKYLVLTLSVTGICVGITMIPVYAVYVGMTIPDEFIEAVSTVVIFGAFLTGTCMYAKDGIDKIKELMGIGNK